MSDTKNFWKGVILGAIAGGALSMLDKKTRDAVMLNCKKTTKNVTYLVKNPSVVVDKVKDTAEQVRQTIDQVSDDFNFIKEKVEVLAETTPQVVGMVRETKDTFIPGEKLVPSENTYVEEDPAQLNKL